MSFYGRVHAAIFHRRNQFRFPGNGKKHLPAEQPPVVQTMDDSTQPLQARGGPTLQDNAQSRGGRSFQDIAERDRTLKRFTHVRERRSQGEFTDLLNDPAYDKRATAVPAAQEEA